MPSTQFTGHLDSSEFISEFYVRFAQEVETSWLPMLAMQIAADKETENLKWIGTAGMPREWVGNRVADNFNTFTLDVTQKTYEQTIDLSVDDMRRDKTGLLKVRLGDMGAKAALHPEVLISTLIIDADTTTSGLCYDGQQAVDTDHSEGSSGTQTNDLTATEVPSANVTTTTAPTPSEMSNVISEAIGYQYGYKDDKGDPNVNGGARNFVVTCGTAQLYSAAVQAVGLSRLASGADNPLDGLRKTKSISVTPLFLPRLSANTAAIQIYRTDGLKPFLWLEELYETVHIGAGSELEVNHRKHRFGTTRIARAAFGEWRSMMEITLS